MVNYLFIPIYQEYEILFLQPYFSQSGENGSSVTSSCSVNFCGPSYSMEVPPCPEMSLSCVCEESFFFFEGLSFTLENPKYRPPTDFRKDKKSNSHFHLSHKQAGYSFGTIHGHRHTNRRTCGYPDRHSLFNRISSLQETFYTDVCDRDSLSRVDCYRTLLPDATVPEKAA